MNRHAQGIELANQDSTDVTSPPSFVFTVMTNIKGMELCLTGTFDECTIVTTTVLEWGINF